jgi:phosphatidylserine/phosphatidylglycerophosphate/cardiolipin synthase-like enzyme
MTTSRTIHSASHYQRREIHELLQSIFLAELVKPSKHIWLVSPWVSDFPVLQRSMDPSASLIGDTTGSTIRLSEVLVTLAELGTSITIVTKPNEKASIEFCKTLRQRAFHSTATERIEIITKDELHTKGLLGDGYRLLGSMNFTFSGVQQNDETVTFDCQPAAIGQTRMAFEQDYPVPTANHPTE